MLEPRKTKYRKAQKGRGLKRQKETRGTKLIFGNFGLQAITSGFITSRQLEAARKAIVHCLKKEGSLWIRIFPDKPITKLPPEVGMGGGKGEVDHYVFPAKPGRIIFELDSRNEKLAQKALLLAADKLALKAKIIKRI